MPDDPFRIEELPRCLSDWRSFNYLFGAPISRGFANRLLELGQGDLMDSYPRPLLKVREPGCFHLVGAVGTRRIKVDYHERDLENTKGYIESSIVEAWWCPCPADSDLDAGA